MGAMVYKWRGNTRLPIAAQAAGEEIEHLKKQANGLLTPAAVVDASRDVKAVLHAAFEWDDSVAAERHREDQARYLIGALIVTVAPRNVQKTTRAFVNVIKDENQGYTALHDALSDQELRDQILVKAWQELEAWRERYEVYSELASVFEAMDAAKAKGSRRDGRRSAA